jgi:hypothetical protein
MTKTDATLGTRPKTHNDGRRRLMIVPAAFVSAMIAGAAEAQTTDLIFQSWRYAEEPAPPRNFALAGAVAGLADDAGCVEVNPGGLATIPRPAEIVLGWQLKSRGTLPTGDRVETSVKATSPMIAVARPLPRFALSVQFVALRSETKVESPDAGLQPRQRQLAASINGPGLGVGYRVNPYVTAGVTINALQLHFDDVRYTTASPLAVRLMSRGKTRVAGVVGVLYRPPVWFGRHQMSFGGALRWPQKWDGNRTANDPVSGRIVDDASLFTVREPAMLSAGVAWQPQLRRGAGLLTTVQLDRLWYSQIRPSAVPGIPLPASDFGVPGRYCFRLGEEATISISRARFQLRGGWRHGPAGTIVYSGPDPEARTFFPQTETRDAFTVGVSVGWTTIWQVSVGARFHDGPTRVVAGVSFRYPGLFP